MPLSAGTRLGPYQILDPIGAGGMGEVYRAQDTRLDRVVAVKVLPQGVTADAAVRERFEREARAVSSLNHPHICALYDVGSQDGIEYLVMEYIEGETLADRLARGPLPLDKVFEHGIQMASALETAHRQGIVHRDLKPGNIMLTKSGAKLLDFGLAKMDQPKTLPLTSMTLTKPLTAAGSILGTFQYMAPEQFEGKEADARSDIFTFGVVLYEMVTGRKAFEGKTQASVMVAILERDPAPLAAAQPIAPPALEHLVATCLAKDPDERRQCVHDVLLELKWIADAVPAPAAAAAPKARSRLAWIAAAVVFIAALALAALHFRETPPDRQLLRYSLAPPEKASVDSFAISPDGRYVTLAASGERGRQLWVRALDSLEPLLLKGTEGAQYPFWSPDSRHIAFFAQGKLKRIAVNGGPAQTLCDVSPGRGGSWNRDGVIVFTPSNSGGLSRVPAAGGVPVHLQNAGANPRFPSFLPDGRFLYMSTGGEAKGGIFLAALDSKENSRLAADHSSPQYLAPAAGSRLGHILFVRENTLMVQPVDPKSMQPAGDLFPVAEQVGTGLASGSYGMYSISENGVLIYQSGRSLRERQHLWFDRGGKELAAVGGLVGSNSLALSPEEKRLLISRYSGSGILSDLWMYDLERGTESRFTFHASSNFDPVWSPDGTHVAFTSNRDGRPPNLFQKAANGTGQDELLLRSDQPQFPTDWSHDGRFIIFDSIEPKTRYDVFALPAGGDRKPIPLLQSEFNERDGHVSPDGRWLAYASEETGRYEIYVQPFAAGAAPDGAKPLAGKWQVSKTGGNQPRWRADGKEIYYLGTDGKLMAVEIAAGGTAFGVATPQALFPLRSDIGPLTPYASSADGKRFLVSTSSGGSTQATSLTVVVNWLAGVKK